MDPDPERLLLTIADHLHEHCECRPGATGGARCAACDLRAQLRDVREQVLAWRAEWRRIGDRRDDAIANGETHLARHAEHCETCASLSQVAGALRVHRAPPDDHSVTSSS
ncbi:MAG: hypothetical protein KDC46_13305 [Thermoleophilia bacterium]|nr:hypothetical protein [Thermoleophilia bacterium]